MKLLYIVPFTYYFALSILNKAPNSYELIYRKVFF